MIGIYDSGLGGLAVLSRLRERFPRADFLYLGDTAHLPYGGQPRSSILQYARGALAVLQRERVSAAMIACGTVSTTLLESGLLQAEFPLYGVASPAARAVARGGFRKVAVLATAASVSTHAYAKKISELCQAASVLELACPALVPLVESGRADPGDEGLLSLLREELAPCLAFCPEAILLGCTHYAWLIPALRRVFPDAPLFDCGSAAADELLPPSEESGAVRYLVSGEPKRFCEAARRLLPAEKIVAEQISIP